MYRSQRATGLLVLVAACLGAASGRALEPGSERARFEALAQAAPGLDPGVLQRALSATGCAERRGLLGPPAVVTDAPVLEEDSGSKLTVLNSGNPN